MITLRAGQATASVLPDMGGGMAGLRVGDRPVLRVWDGSDDPFKLAMNLLLPFSNRISGGFPFEGVQHALSPNLEGEPFPIHGDAFQKSWKVRHLATDSVTLTLTDGAFGPFRYHARVRYELSRSTLSVSLGLTSLAPMPLPYGLGLHPWFPRASDTRLQFAARSYWPETEDHLPAVASAIDVPRDLDFGTSRALPHGWINAGFSGWPGAARLDQGRDAVSVDLSAEALSTAILYSPDATADVFCFEPVSHPVDAHNLKGHPGLAILDTNQGLSGVLRITWH